jgi:hypothetical protein
MAAQRIITHFLYEINDESILFFKGKQINSFMIQCKDILSIGMSKHVCLC